MRFKKKQEEDEKLKEKEMQQLTTDKKQHGERINNRNKSYVPNSPAHILHRFKTKTKKMEAHTQTNSLKITANLSEKKFTK